MDKNTKKPNRTPQSFEEAAKDFEQSKLDEMRKSRKTAWVVAGVATSICTVSILAFLVALLIRKDPEPVIIQVDKGSGFTTVLKSIKNAEDTYDEVINRYWLARHLIVKESYDWFTISEQFETVKLQSEPYVFDEYARKVQAPESPLETYKDKARVEVKIISISFISNVAQVRFTTEKKSPDGTNQDNAPLQKWIATIGFAFKSGAMTDQQRLLNPLGFKVNSYRVDPEVMR